MLPDSPVVTLLLLIGYVTVGMAIGGLSGWLTSIVTRIGSGQVLKDAFIGALGLIGGFLVCAYLLWHQNTITYRLSGGTQVTSTANFYQYPERVAVFAAVVLPILHELNRFRLKRRYRSR